MSLELLTCARIAIIAVAAVCVALLILRAHRARILNDDVFTVYASGSLVTFMVLAIVAQAVQLGKPLATWWGTPGFAIGTVLTLIALGKSKVPWR